MLIHMQRITAASILLIGFSYIIKCVTKDGFRRDSHIYTLQYNYKFSRHVNFEDVTARDFIFEDYQPLENSPHSYAAT